MVLGRDMESPVVLPETLDATVQPEQSLDRLLTLALERRPDLEAADRQVQSADAGVRQVRGVGKGDVGLVGMVEANDENFFGASGSNWSVFLNARFTLFDGKSNSSRVAQARAGLRESESRRRQLERMVGLEVRESFHGMRAARARVDQAQEAVDLATESLRIVRDRYGEGLTTLVELLDAETALTRSRVRRVAAERDLLIADASLRLATGGL
jgi:outer membrane protein TolC